MSKLIVRIEAERDIAEAHAEYKGHSVGLGDRFLEQVELSLARIKANPKQYQVLYRGIRRALTHRFPYGIFFIDSEQHVSVLAVIHTARSPEIWKRRITLSKNP